MDIAEAEERDTAKREEIDIAERVKKKSVVESDMRFCGGKDAKFKEC